MRKLSFRLSGFLRQRVRAWLGWSDMTSHYFTLDSRLSGLEAQFRDQMLMVGVDVHLKPKAQTTVVFVSRLGPQGNGTVKIVELQLKDMAELRDIIHHLERAYGTDKTAFDAPFRISDWRGR